MKMDEQAHKNQVIGGKQVELLAVNQANRFTLRSSRLIMILEEEVVMFSFLKHRPDVPPVGLCRRVT